jgi:protein SCO1/2
MWLLVAALVLLAGCASTSPSAAIVEPLASASASAEPRQVVDPPKQLIDFELPSNTGKNVKLSDFRGKPVLMFFGYTHCPDFCPATMGEFKQVKQKLGDQGDDVAFVFVSVDGERDTPAVLDRYVKNFDPTFIGLSGTSDRLKPIAKDYGLYAKKNTDVATANEYLVDHTVATYLIDQQGRLRSFYPFEATSDTLANDVQVLLKEQS